VLGSVESLQKNDAAQSGVAGLRKKERQIKLVNREDEKRESGRGSLMDAEILARERGWGKNGKTRHRGHLRERLGVDVALQSGLSRKREASMLGSHSSLRQEKNERNTVNHEPGGKKASNEK